MEHFAAQWFDIFTQVDVHVNIYWSLFNRERERERERDRDRENEATVKLEAK